MVFQIVLTCTTVLVGRLHHSILIPLYSFTENMYGSLSLYLFLSSLATIDTVLLYWIWFFIVCNATSYLLLRSMSIATNQIRLYNAWRCLPRRILCRLFFVSTQFHSFNALLIENNIQIPENSAEFPALSRNMLMLRVPTLGILQILFYIFAFWQF